MSSGSAGKPEAKNRDPDSASCLSGAVCSVMLCLIEPNQDHRPNSRVIYPEAKSKISTKKNKGFLLFLVLKIHLDLERGCKYLDIPQTFCWLALQGWVYFILIRSKQIKNHSCPTSMICMSMTLVPVGPVINNWSISLKNLYESFLAKYCAAEIPLA